MFKSILQKFKHSNFGLVVDWRFHKERKWVSALTPYLIDAIVKEFRPVIISSQEDYDRYKDNLRYIISAEPGWAAPKIKYDTGIDCVKAVFYSDPHNDTKNRFDYFNNNGFDYVFSYYDSPFFYHFKDFPKEKFIHMPWAIPDEFISENEITVRNSEVVIFGGQNSDAYDVRNWCRNQPGITNYNNSGVENKKMTDEEYFVWLSKFDAIIAAGSSNPIYDLVTPKYFEIASAGSLLIGQRCKDLDTLGFNDENMLIFEKEDFLRKVEEFKKNPEVFIKMRKKGRAMIKERHTISKRIEKIKETFERNN